jgi:tRNA1(Val) A37 N6-methylase TrmN6
MGDSSLPAIAKLPGTDSDGSLDWGRVTLDRLAGEWWIHQLKGGNRYSTDDVLTAWSAVNEAPSARRVLDLGAGVGSVGLMAILALGEEAALTAVEVQVESVALLRRTLERNELGKRVVAILGDLREDGTVPPAARYDLITANPPYLPAGNALRSPHPQRAAARMELNGDVYDFCRAAARHLDAGGVFCFSFAAGDGRPEEAAARAGLSIRSRREVIFREGDRPVIALYACGRGGDRADARPITVRHRDGRRTEEYRAIRRRMLIEA